MCKDLLNNLLDRGLNTEEGMHCIMDGSKRIRKAAEELFGRYGLIQSCQWHKRENVVDYLPKWRQAAFRKLLQKAHEKHTYEGAKMSLKTDRVYLQSWARASRLQTA